MLYKTVRNFGEIHYITDNASEGIFPKRQAVSVITQYVNGVLSATLAFRLEFDDQYHSLLFQCYLEIDRNIYQNLISVKTLAWENSILIWGHKVNT